jgi:hypothetical protein
MDDAIQLYAIGNQVLEAGRHDYKKQDIAI